jgi:hypothetical protein
MASEPPRCTRPSGVATAAHGAGAERAGVVDHAALEADA